MTDEAQQLFVYAIDDPDTGSHRFYASFLPQDAVFSGGLPAAAIVGQVLGDTSELDPSRFAVNSAFVELLHACIAKHAAQCPALLSEAARQRVGHVYLIDARTPNPDGPVPPHDIIGAVAVEAGAIKDYHRNPNHQVLTADGVVRLDPWMHDRLQAELRQLSSPPN